MMFIARMDQNGDGRISPDEVDERRRGFIEDRFQIDLSKPVEIATLRQQVERRNGDASQEKTEAAAAYLVEGSQRLKGRKSYRSNGRDLPSKLPDWWDDRDSNKDGQVSLVEFARRVDSETIGEFKDLDLNSDGLITAREAALAVE